MLVTIHQRYPHHLPQFSKVHKANKDYFFQFFFEKVIIHGRYAEKLLNFDKHLQKVSTFLDEGEDVNLSLPFAPWHAQLLFVNSCS